MIGLETRPVLRIKKKTNWPIFATNTLDLFFIPPHLLPESPPWKTYVFRVLYRDPVRGVRKRAADLLNSWAWNTAGNINPQN
jgi:hypothetical protein